ncbi:MAG: hypothetical protein OXC07_04450 [Kistimonas sp.]|nr:hypothetical protein [Kistimonas sp.]
MTNDAKTQVSPEPRTVLNPLLQAAHHLPVPPHHKGVTRFRYSIATQSY